jgi:hypothetical protein
MTSRRDRIFAAVGAHNLANPLVRLPRSTAPLLVAMFPTDNVCQLSLEAIAALGFSARMLPTTLRRLTDAGFLTRLRVPDTCPRRVSDIWWLHIPPLGRQQP